VSIGNTRGFNVEGRERPQGDIRDALYRVGTSDYLQTIDARLVAGRLIDDRDASGAPPVVVINETMARQYWPNESAIGRRISFSQSPTWITVVGVVRTCRAGLRPRWPGVLPAERAGGPTASSCA
jgi:hypothetical protein